MLPSHLALRALVPTDSFLLRTATLLNLNWKGERFGYAQMDAEPRLARYYLVDFGRGDFGTVASLAQKPVGILWVRYFTADEPGYGFVRPDVPELCLCVLPGYRGEGVGSRLLDAVINEADHQALTELSLSVEEGNPARRLYERFGFEPVEPAPPPGGLMHLVIRPTRSQRF
jgi:ribosomal protein S18 acetylase RimI-like enzyme